MRSDLIFAQDRAEALARELETATGAVSQLEAGANADGAYRVRSEVARGSGSAERAIALLGEADAREHERRGQQDMLAKLVERAEKAEVELGKAQGQVGTLQQQLRSSHGAQARGTGAIATASKVRQLCHEPVDLLNVPARIVVSIPIDYSAPSYCASASSCSIESVDLCAEVHKRRLDHLHPMLCRL